ncbi:MAG: class I SAM-dependent methyltransferase [Gemmatimonadota bacterium]|nr:class I SAM-dependent methyltransferase [Gemmatimonadota bacterium]
MTNEAHWEKVFATKEASEMSWYQAMPIRSLELLREAGAESNTDIIDVGGGDSLLVDTILAGRLGCITVLDISGGALDRARARLGPRASEVTWLRADVTRVDLAANAFDVWHDRAVFHFLTTPDERARYVAAAKSSLRPGGFLIIATFAADGPTTCSGLEVARYSTAALLREFGDDFVLRRDFADVHRTPAGIEQRFTIALLQLRS